MSNNQWWYFEPDANDLRLYRNPGINQVNAFRVNYNTFNNALVLAQSGVSIGTTTPATILSVVPNSATDPIADAWTSYSSRRWKTNIRPLESALDKVERLRGVTFEWKADGKRDIGLIAEEVGQVVPEVVAYEDNGEDARSVDYARLTALLIEAVKGTANPNP